MIFITMCIIAYNEEKTLRGILDDICMQDYDHSYMEVLLVDSASTDATKEIMREFADGRHNFRSVLVLDNPKKTLPCGWNVALGAYTGEVILKVDAHARIPADFVSKNAAVLESGENICGGARPNVIDEDTPWQRTLFLAESSMFGSSIAPYRRNPGRSYVNSMFHAAYRREVFERVGGFNEKLGRTEDNEIHYRIRKAGYKLCFDPDIISYQHIRSSLHKMLKQKYANGYWIALTTGVCPQCLSIYHYVPFAFVMAIIISAVLLLIGAAADMPALFGITACFTGLMWGAYCFLAVVMAVMAAVKADSKDRSYANLCLPVLFFLLHISYGIGTAEGFVKLPKFLREYRK